MLVFFFLLFSHFLSDWSQISHALVSAAPGGGLLEFLLSPVVLSGDMQISPGLVASPRPRVLSQVGGLQNPLPGSPQPPEKTWILPLRTGDPLIEEAT